MAAARTFEHKGVIVDLWDKSFRIRGMSKVVFLGEPPDEAMIRSMIDACQAAPFTRIADAVRRARLTPKQQAAEPSKYQYFASAHFGIRQPSTWLARLTDWARGLKDRPQPVPGWIAQYLLSGIGVYLAFASWADKSAAATFLVGSTVIGVIRVIERERRDDE
jgi:hypothetical protein